MIISLTIAILYFFYSENEAKSTYVNVYEKLSSKEDIHYLIVGDSIGRGAGVEKRSLTWFNQWEKLMNEKFGVTFKRNSIVQSGATAFEGLYLFNHASNKPQADFIFILFGENDRKYMNANQFAYFYESLLREIKGIYPDAEMMTITESCLTDETFAREIKKLSTQYQTTHIDMRIAFQQSPYTKEQLSDDLVHPNYKGYQLYAEAIFKTIETRSDHYKKGQERVIDKPATTRSFTEINQYSKMNGNFIRKASDYCTNKAGASISYKFIGEHVGAKVLVGQEQGYIDVFIDQQYIRTLSTKWPVQKHRVLYIESQLPAGEHEVTFVYSNKNSTLKKKQPKIQISSILLYK